MRWERKRKRSLLGEVCEVLGLSMSTDTSGLVSDELMLEIVKTELDRLRGKVSCA